MCYVQQPMLLSFNSKLQLHTFDLLFVDYRLSPKQFPCDSKGKKGQFQLLGKGIPFFLRVIFDVRILGRPLKFDYFKEILVCVMCITHGIIINQIGQPIAIFLSNMKRTEESNIHHITLSVLSCLLSTLYDFCTGQNMALLVKAQLDNLVSLLQNCGIWVKADPDPQQRKL